MSTRPDDVEQQERTRHRVRWINFGWCVFLSLPFLVYWLVWLPGWVSTYVGWILETWKQLFGP